MTAHPVDRALAGAAPPHHGCSAYANGVHGPGCPGAVGLDDDLPQTPEPTGPVGSTAATAGATP